MDQITEPGKMIVVYVGEKNTIDLGTTDAQFFQVAQRIGARIDKKYAVTMYNDAAHAGPAHIPAIAFT
jgi:hypothetical protein